MPREQYVRESLSALFVERRCGLWRRKTDLVTNGHESVPKATPLPSVHRWVQLAGKSVRFSQGIGPFQGRLHVHHLPTPEIAYAFAVALLKTDEDGYPSALDPEEWARWQEEYGRF